MNRLLAVFLALLAIALPAATQADPADIDAAARSVVRVVIIDQQGEEVYPVSHGSGFAVSRDRIVTNAHVVREALMDDTLRIGIVPSEGDDATFGKPIAVSPRNDLALIEITGDLRLPPLTLSGSRDVDSGEVSSVGYPMNVDRAQGLDIQDIFDSQPPVKSRGFLSGRRPSREFDTLLHTAPIARGNSGGPLLDGCGRVLGVNSFGADSDGSDAEFYFAVSNRELLPFLKANGVTAQVNSLPCRSLSELDAAERSRIEREQSEARSQLAARAEEQRSKRARAQLEAELAVQEERENAMALALLAALAGIALLVLAQKLRRKALAEGNWADMHEAHAFEEDAPQEADEVREKARKLQIFAAVSAVAAALCIIAAIALWFTRPGLDAIDRKVNAAMADGETGAQTTGPATAAADGMLVCTLQVDRSRITGTPNETVEFDWSESGCVNGRTQYGFAGGTWSRVFVPSEEAAVSVNSYDPASRTYRTDRYLLGRSAMSAARSARGKYSPPQCQAENAAAELGDMQGAVTALLPPSPNERLVYSCEAKAP